MTVNVSTIASADERIAELVKPQYMERIPSFVREHAIGSTCKVVAREFPAIYEVFSRDEEPSDNARQQMEFIVNEVFREHMGKHGML